MVWGLVLWQLCINHKLRAARSHAPAGMKKLFLAEALEGQSSRRGLSGGHPRLLSIAHTLIAHPKATWKSARCNLT